MCLAYDGRFIVDSLHEAYLDGTERHGRSETAYKIYADHIARALSTHANGSSAWNKWKWMETFLAMARRRHGIGV